MRGVSRRKEGCEHMSRKLYDLALRTGKTRSTFEAEDWPAGIPVDGNGNNREAVIINLFAGKERVH